MLRQIVERAMEVKEGERRFSPELRQAYFGSLGGVPILFSERIIGADFGEEAQIGRFRTNLDLIRTDQKTGNEVSSRIAAGFFRNGFDAEAMADRMNDPANLARANRVLDETIAIRNNWLVAGGVAGGLLISTAVHYSPI